MTATPRPWKVLSGSYDGGIYTKVVSENHNEPFYCLVAGHKANAALIVKAVNEMDQHEQLKQEVVRFLDHYQDKEGQLGNGHARHFYDRVAKILFNWNAPVAR